ncbi:hypothetical protein ACFVZR_33470 [Streptomyces sp. NPDC058316]|uniref:hypothetical protein n=1 Tax=unclassified Streptomyces TaxID=2593676 RepID=UPI003324B570
MRSWLKRRHRPEGAPDRSLGSARPTEVESAVARSVKVVGQGATAIHTDGEYGMV